MHSAGLPTPIQRIHNIKLSWEAKDFGGGTLWKGLFGRPKRRWEYNIKRDLKETVSEEDAWN
jgi:hypothetical protein